MNSTEIKIKRFEVCFCCLGYFSFAETIFLYNEHPCCETCYYLLLEDNERKSIFKLKNKGGVYTLF